MLTVWREPQANHIYCLGVDTSEGLVHGDYSCAQVLDVRTVVIRLRYLAWSHSP